VSLPREKWAGYIKDYDGGTLMECKIHPRVNYLRVPEIIKSQREVRYFLPSNFDINLLISLEVGDTTDQRDFQVSHSAFSTSILSYLSG